MATDLGKVGMRMRGDWDSSTAYEVLDAVSYNNGFYIAKQAVPANTLPTNTTYWQMAVDNSDVTPQDISASFTTSEDFSLRYAIIINNTVYLNFYAGNVTASGVYVFAGLMTANKPKYLTPVILYPGGNSIPSNVQGAIDSAGQFIIRTGGTSLSAAKYEVMAIYRTI